MPSDHPFQLLFETFGKLPDTHSDEVNKEARETMKSWLKVPLEYPGHCILLKAPRAGHGKTHLLTRLQHDLGGTHEFIPLHAIGGSRIDAATVLDDTLRRLVRGLPAAGGLTVLDLVARRLFSSSLQPLVNSGEVPCQDREGAINALRTRPIETFDFHHPGAVTAHWARDNFELLGPRLALELSQGRGLSLREVSFWVDAMFRFSATPIDSPGRVRALAATVFEDPGAEAVAHERLVALLGLITSLMRVVLIADEIEGFSSDETAALRFASFLGTLRQSAERVDVVLSVNDDVWKSAFLPRLSGGLTDRLSEVVVELEPLDRAGMLAIIESRSPGDGEKILSEMEPDTIPTHARGLIKEAGTTWEDAAQGKTRKTPEQQKPEPAPEPAFSQDPAPTQKPMAEEPSSSSAAAIKPSPEQSAPEQEKSVVNPFSGSETAQPFVETAPQAPLSDFSAPEPSKNFETPSPKEAPRKEGFSAEAAIAAFAAAPPSESYNSMFSSDEPAIPLPSKFDEAQDTPYSWPSPEVVESVFQAPKEDAASETSGSPSELEKKEESASTFSAPPTEPEKMDESSSAFTAPAAHKEKEEQPYVFAAAPPEKTEEPFSAFSAAPNEPEPQPEEEQPSIFQAPPAEPSSIFGAPPVPGQTEEPSSVFQAAPNPTEEAISAFQASPKEEVAPPAQQENLPTDFSASPPPVQESAFHAPSTPQENPVTAFQASTHEQQSAFSAAPPAQNTPGAIQTSPESSPPEIPQESSSAEKTTEASTDRVDDLLRQFRERYGKS